jgi:predicted amidohydrolase YtcJ
VTLDEALSAYADGAARLAGNRLSPGTLTPGAPADLVVWDADLHAMPPSRLHAARPRFTVLAGEVVHDAASTSGSDTRVVEVAS